MCTISLVPHPESFNGFILTSNRDEAVGRKTLPPAKEKYRGKKLYFPKDSVAGGTWIGVSENKRCVCLMNGAEKPHERKSSYRESRGVVVKDFLVAEELSSLLKIYDFQGIEAFTMIIVNWQKKLEFYEIIWNELELKISNLALKEYIWSSSPLYSEKAKALRKKWFRKLKEAEGFSAKSLLNFHHTAGEGNSEFDLIIDRGFLKTQSISQVKFTKNQIQFSYEDLNTGKMSTELVQFNA